MECALRIRPCGPLLHRLQFAFIFFFFHMCWDNCKCRHAPRAAGTLGANAIHPPSSILLFLFISNLIIMIMWCIIALTWPHGNSTCGYAWICCSTAWTHWAERKTLLPYILLLLLLFFLDRPFDHVVVIRYYTCTDTKACTFRESWLVTRLHQCDLDTSFFIQCRKTRNEQNRTIVCVGCAWRWCLEAAPLFAIPSDTLNEIVLHYDL